MSVVAKALALLEHFSIQTPELGLSRLTRLAKRDKATTYRHLVALQELGFIEQNPETKAYRIGPAVLHLAEVREKTVPRRDGALAPLQRLADATGETAHASILSGPTLHTLVSCEAQAHSIRAVIDLQKLPLHATASGICTLAFGPADLLEAAKADMARFTAHTATDPAALAEVVGTAQGSGFGRSERGLEDDIYGFAAPLFDQTGQLAGAVAVASVASRVTEDLTRLIYQELIIASREITHSWGGSVPAAIEALWADTLATFKQKDLAP
ncbi:helix-turn-helix domain-containing protein [Sulfitobacter sp. JBTF-M27]|uniref:Helix-turn-helix domain-containing protein n=1 Tax=Sulfitobacter sediminilitoris TaxID=2698830 RepID=A0A6P0C3W2_9RHOB|nr:IclR family transcriptional regulator C-terminal domain-containing protein [Sulfitobacter sediminilitoris]NEK20832.1 helix-turn-helix domain-containing protein [Sulfitobacter sediminilitoris]